MRKKKHSRRNPYKLYGVVGLGLVLAGAALLVRFTTLPPVAVYLVALNLATSALCAYDKRIAGGSTTRVPEFVFLGAALLGGSPGLLLGMGAFRHKTQKMRFQVGLGAVVVAQIAALTTWLS